MSLISYIIILMKNILFISLILMSFLNINAQQKREQINYQLTGFVADKNTNNGLEFATIVLKPIQGGEIFGGLTNSKGNFKIKVPEGIYNISVEFISFKTISFANINVNRDIKLGQIYLEENAEALEEVEIIAERSTMEVRLDKKIYNVGKDMTVKGGTASDVLDNVPSVTVDADGVVSLRGNENVRILINGKPSGLVGINDTEALRQFPAEVIKQVEVITSPSARYDAEGTAGIINIILRRDKALGFNGSILANIGYPESYGLSTNLNYRLKKVNFFTNIGYSNRDSPGEAITHTEYFSPTASFPYVEENRDYNRSRSSLNTNFGLEYFITDKSSITASVLFRNSDRNTLVNNATDKFDEDLTLIESNLRIENEDEIDKVNQYSLNFTQDFKNSGHKLTMDFQYQDNGETENSIITNEEIFPNEIDNPSQKIDADENQERMLLQADYVLPIGEKQQFEAGFRSNINDQTTDYLYYDEIDGDFVLNENVSNIFIYDENIHAFYSQYGNKFGKISALFGIRYEISDITVQSKSHLNDNFKTTKNYGDWFPTLNVAYEFSESENITFGYNRRIRRPRSRFINPFPSQSSQSNIFQGNPDLDPSISDGIDLGYYKRWSKLGFNTSIYFSHATDVFQFISEDTGEETEDGIPIIKRSPINLNTNDRYGFEFSLNYTPIKQWRFNLSLNVYNSTIEGFYEDIDYGSNNTSWFTRFSGKVVLPASIDWQTTMMYRGPSENSQSRREGVFSTNMAFSKDILKGNGTLSLNVNDLFNSRKRKSETLTDDFSSYSEFQWRQRSVRLSFAYRFKQKKKRTRQGNSNSDGGGEEFGG